MANGIINGKTANRYIASKITWSSVPNTSGNYSDVTASLSYSRTNTGYETSGTWSGGITINGNTLTGSKVVSITYNSNTVVITYKVRVYHNSDGKKSITISAYGKVGTTSLSSTTVSGVAVLDNIPRGATFTSAPNFNDEENPTIEYSNPKGNNATSLRACISLTGAVDDVYYREIAMDENSYTFELTDEEREILRIATTGSNKRKVIFFIRTVIDGTNVDNTAEREFSIINGSPTLAPTVVDTNETTIALTGDARILIKNHSDVAVDSGAQVYKNATIKSQKVICGNKSLNDGSGTVEDVGSGAFIFSITDNRENTVTQTINAPFIEYVNLTCNLSANAPDAEGDMAFSVSGNCFSGSFGATDNVVRVYYRYKANDDEYGKWIEWPEVVLNSDNTYVANVNISDLDYEKRYTIQAMASDSLMEIASVERVVKTIPVYDWGENDFNFNVPVNVNGDFSLNGTKMSDYIIEQGTSGIWTYRKWASGEVELWARTYVECEVSIQQGGTYRSEQNLILLPFTVYNHTHYVTLFDHNSWATTAYRDTNTTSLGLVIFRGTPYGSYKWNFNIYVKGRWKQ